MVWIDGIKIRTVPETKRAIEEGNQTINEDPIKVVKVRIDPEKRKEVDRIVMVFPVEKILAAIRMVLVSVDRLDNFLVAQIDKSIGTISVVFVGVTLRKI